MEQFGHFTLRSSPQLCLYFPHHLEWNCRLVKTRDKVNKQTRLPFDSMVDLAGLLLASLNPDSRKQAEQNLNALGLQQGFPSHFLGLVLDPAQDHSVRLSGSSSARQHNISQMRTFLNFLKLGFLCHWGAVHRVFLTPSPLLKTATSTTTMKFPLTFVSSPNSSSTAHSFSGSSRIRSGFEIFNLLKSRSNSSSVFLPVSSTAV
jgi:hypothetical protein